MAWPPTTIATDKANATGMVDDHAPHHNTLAGAINDLVAFNPAPVIATINAQTGTTYTIALSDAGIDKLTTLGNADAITLTVPKNSVIPFPIGSVVPLLQVLAGIVTVAPVDGDVTISKPTGSTLVFEDQGSAATLIKTGTDAWWIVGRLADA